MRKSARVAPLVLAAGGRGQTRSRGADPLLAAALGAPGVPSPSVAYVGAASGDNRAFLLMIGALLKRAGAGRVTLAPLCGRRADAARARRVMEEADVVFVSGGDVEEGMRILSDRKMLPFFRDLQAAGKPFLGVSAGSIMLALSWVRWRDPDDDTTAEHFPCIGLAPLVCDTHGEADDWVELKAYLALAPAGTVGYGIVSGTALRVEADGGIAAQGGDVHVFKRLKSGVKQQANLRPA